MDRCAVLVDAGYLYAEGGKLCCGTPARGRSALQPSLAVELLQKVALETTQLPVLRTYWYDGARDGIRTQEQREVAGLPNVKLRLGRLNAKNQQKGVDALIYRDLITLAQHRAISDAVLLSGDEDLREGVRAAQDYGVRVVLVGIACADGNGHNQSEELVLDADHLAVLSKPQLEPMFTSRSPVATGRAPRPQGWAQDKSVAGTSASGAAAAFAREWLRAATEAEIADLNIKRPNIPRPVDIELLTAVEKTLERSLKDDEVSRRDARSAFWGVIGGTMGNRTAPS
ncbi:MAG: NYN domain-containing protein [Pseudonocardiaceae bacterium]